MVGNRGFDGQSCRANQTGEWGSAGQLELEEPAQCV